VIQAEVREYWVEWDMYDLNGKMHEKEDCVLSYSSDEVYAMVQGSELKNSPGCTISIKRIITKAQHENEIKE